MNEHEGHDQDTSHDQECACGEIVRCPEGHVCKPIGWSEPVAIPDPPLFRLWGTPGPEAYIPLRPNPKRKP